MNRIGFSQRLELRQSQALVMTPQLQQAIKMLQLSNLELAEFVDGEIEQNPLLEQRRERSRRRRRSRKPSRRRDATGIDGAMAGACRSRGCEGDVADDADDRRAAAGGEGDGDGPTTAAAMHPGAATMAAAMPATSCPASRTPRRGRARCAST